jgi:hypothetical protein
MERFTQEALELDREFLQRHPNGKVTEKRIDTLVGKRFHAKTKPDSDILDPRCKDHQGPASLYKRKNISQLLPSDLEAIVHSVKVDYQTYESAAAFNNVKFSLVQTIMSSLKKDPEYINKRKEKLL